VSKSSQIDSDRDNNRLNLFFIGELPGLIDKNRPLARHLLSAHKTLGFSLLGLIVLHVSAALFHHLWRRDDTLAAMLAVAAAWRTREPRADQLRDANTAPSRGVRSEVPN
jgi:4-hydroxybenzoate polyprenyltransferase